MIQHHANICANGNSCGPGALPHARQEGGRLMTLTELARAYYSEGSRGHPVCQRQKERLFLNDLRFDNGRFKPLKSLLKRMSWREERPLNRRQLALIIARLGEA